MRPGGPGASLPAPPLSTLPTAAPTSEDVDRELSRPRLFFPGGLLLVLKESLLPAAEIREGGQGLESGPCRGTARQRLSLPDWAAVPLPWGGRP